MGNWRTEDDGTVVINLRGDDNSQQEEKSNMDGLYICGKPDNFDIMIGDRVVAYCNYESYDAYPFIIANDKVYIGNEGEGHWDIGWQLIDATPEEIQAYYSSENTYELECKRDAAVAKLQQAKDYAAGRIWLGAEPNDMFNDEFEDYVFISFWDSWDKPKPVSARKIEELLSAFRLDRNKIFIANIANDDSSYGRLIKYTGGDITLAKISQKQMNDYAIHLMNAKQKHDATSNFRAVRDKAIYAPREKAAGTMAAYHNMVHSENIKKIVRNVLKEYIDKDSKKLISETWTNNNTELKNHLKNIAHMDDKTLKTLANVFPTYYLNYLMHVNPGIENEDYYYDLVDVTDNRSKYPMSYYIEKLNLPIDKRFGYYVKNTINKFPRRYYDDSRINYRYTEIPDNVTLNYKKPFINKVLVHKCSNDGDAENILLNGFKYGQDLGNLAWSCGVKNNGNYGFAYEFNDYAENCNNYPNYGAEGVVFIGSGVMVTHHGDRRNKYDKSPNECIFDINSVSSFVCRFRVSHGYCEIYNANNKLVLKKENYTIPKALEWISNNLIRY